MTSKSSLDTGGGGCYIALRAILTSVILMFSTEALGIFDSPAGLIWTYGQGNTDWDPPGHHANAEAAAEHLCENKLKNKNARADKFHGSRGYSYELTHCSLVGAPEPSGPHWQARVRNDFDQFYMGEFTNSFSYDHNAVRTIAACWDPYTFNSATGGCTPPPCDTGEEWNPTVEQCERQVRCPSPYVLSAFDNQCEAYCSEGETWDATVSACVPPPEQQNCGTQSDQPIDFIQGRKYRDEPVIDTGKRFPLALHYRYNNQGNQELSPTGSPIAVLNASRYLAATTAPVSAAEYKNSYRPVGVPNDSQVYRATQEYGNTSQYWRHNFDEVLLVLGDKFQWRRPRGQTVVFSSLGVSTTYPHIELRIFTAADAASSGYELVDSKSNVRKQFNSNGRLLKIVRSHNDSITLSYDAQGRLDRVTNSEGAFIQLAYTTLTTDSIYSVEASVQNYPISVTNDRGQTVQIEWGQAYHGQTGKFRLITQITEPTVGEGASARAFEYNDTRFGASLTDIFFIADVTQDSREPLFHFEYDEQGRAVYSGTVAQGGADSVEYVDENTRVITNALGKKAVYEFADINGARRLKRVTGEPTQNCVQSELEYTYDAAGNVAQKIENGSTTQYAYDSQNREISRTEAAGTPEARTITTEYHPALNKPVKITGPGKVTTMTYDAEGRLLSSTTQSTVAP